MTGGGGAPRARGTLLPPPLSTWAEGMAPPPGAQGGEWGGELVSALTPYEYIPAGPW